MLVVALKRLLHNDSIGAERFYHFGTDFVHHFLNLVNKRHSETYKFPHFIFTHKEYPIGS